MDRSLLKYYCCVESITSEDPEGWISEYPSLIRKTRISRCNYILRIFVYAFPFSVLIFGKLLLPDGETGAIMIGKIVDPLITGILAIFSLAIFMEILVHTKNTVYYITTILFAPLLAVFLIAMNNVFILVNEVLTAFFLIILYFAAITIAGLTLMVYSAHKKCEECKANTRKRMENYGTV
jgi:hypothetical protein